MVSELARLTYIGKEKLMRLFNRKCQSSIEELRADLEKKVEVLARECKSSEEAIERLKIEAAGLLEELRLREEEQIKLGRIRTSEWLRSVGIDPDKADEFNKDPSFAKLEELRSKHPYPQK